MCESYSTKTYSKLSGRNPCRCTKITKVQPPRAINGENRPLLADEPVEYEKYLNEVQDFKKFADHFKETYEIYLKLIKKIPKNHNM
jgi:hypothetical protein